MSNITVTVKKTIQEVQYEPLTIEHTITESCTKAKYDERLTELTTEMTERIYDMMGLTAEEEDDLNDNLHPDDVDTPTEVEADNEPDTVGNEELPETDSFDEFLNEGEGGGPEEEDDIPI